MEALTDLFALADAYGTALDLKEGTVSDRVLKGGNRLRDLRASKGDIGVNRLKTAIQWFSDNWPDGTAWPKGVARPKPTPPSTEAAKTEAEPAS